MYYNDCVVFCGKKVRSRTMLHDRELMEKVENLSQYSMENFRLSLITLLVGICKHSFTLNDDTAKLSCYHSSSCRNNQLTLLQSGVLSLPKVTNVHRCRHSNPLRPI
ncbi:hypothetical protein F442_08959 [Phytophthora nicotianae P10297]|uniref:Uncharacterized protein n=1 Tax=Phytophthora nicotianae P10297 TaxID=1317064 RepID=W2ZAP0_PHYNI|nr:hypothetical protein F442_08959 [Phytophthora nicotianae P10297]